MFVEKVEFGGNNGGFGGESSRCKGFLSGERVSVIAEGSYKLGEVYLGRGHGVSLV